MVNDSGGPDQRRAWLLESEGNAEHGGLTAEGGQPHPLAWIHMPCPGRNGYTESGQHFLLVWMGIMVAGKGEQPEHVDSEIPM